MVAAGYHRLVVPFYRGRSDQDPPSDEAQLHIGQELAREGQAGEEAVETAYIGDRPAGLSDDASFVYCGDDRVCEAKAGGPPRARHSARIAR